MVKIKAKNQLKTKNKKVTMKTVIKSIRNVTMLLLMGTSIASKAQTTGTQTTVNYVTTQLVV